MQMYIALDNREFQTAEERDQHNKNLRAQAEKAGVSADEFLGGIKVHGSVEIHDHAVLGVGLYGENK